MNLSLVEKAELVLICGDNYKTVREATDIFNERHPGNRVHYSTVSRILKHFKETGLLNYNYKTEHTKPVTSEENQLLVLQTVIENPRRSIKEISEYTDIKKTSVNRILKRNQYHPYKPKFICTFQERDYNLRYDFAIWVQGEIEEQADFHRHILFGDESTFTTNGVVSSQNCRWWSNDNPNFVIDNKNQYYQKTNVWCGILNDTLIGPYFFRENLTGATYLHFLENVLGNFLDDMTLEARYQVWFLHDGCPAHSTRHVSQWLNRVFGNKWIGRNTDPRWPPRSPDLTPLDFFLWGYLKQKVYKDRPFNNVEELENSIRFHCENIPVGMLRSTLSEFHRRTIICIEREGGHTEAIR